MKKKTIVVALMGLMTFAGLILWPRTQDNSYLDAQNIIVTDDTIQLYLTCAESAPKFVYYDVSYDRGIYNNCKIKSVLWENMETRRNTYRNELRG